MCVCDKVFGIDAIVTVAKEFFVNGLLNAKEFGNVYMYTHTYTDMYLSCAFLISINFKRGKFKV